MKLIHCKVGEIHSLRTEMHANMCTIADQLRLGLKQFKQWNAIRSQNMTSFTAGSKAALRRNDNKSSDSDSTEGYVAVAK